MDSPFVSETSSAQKYKSSNRYDAQSLPREITPAATGLRERSVPRLLICQSGPRHRPSGRVLIMVATKPMDLRTDHDSLTAMAKKGAAQGSVV